MGETFRARFRRKPRSVRAKQTRRPANAGRWAADIGPSSEPGSRLRAGRPWSGHPHFVGTDPENHFLFVPDLGSDQVVIYKLDPEKCGLQPHGAGHCPPGSGPRHLVFHPNGRFAYVVNEMKITVTAFRYDPAAGTLKEIQTIESLPEKDKKLPSTAAEIYIHPSGRFLYAQRGTTTRSPRSKSIRRAAD